MTCNDHSVACIGLIAQNYTMDIFLTAAKLCYECLSDGEVIDTPTLQWFLAVMLLRSCMTGH